MKFITVRDIRTTPAQIWKELPEEQEMVITNNGKPIALLTPINDTSLEETLTAIRQARAINAVRQIQQNAIKTGKNKLSDEEINVEIQKARKSKRK
jgi:antitoxin (DNA-binding transcriptional repressor) of toxin-antitoxin stability system